MLDKLLKLASLIALPILLWIALGARGTGRYQYYLDADKKQFKVFDTWTGTVFEPGGKGIVEFRATTATLINHELK